MRIKAVLLDFGDTLVGFDQFDYDACLRALHRSLLRDGITLSYDDFNKAYFEARDRIYREVEDSLEERSFCFRVSEALRQFGYSFDPSEQLIIDAVEVFMDLLVDSVRMDEPVPSILQKLHQKYKLGLVSNFGYPPAITKILKKFDLISFFDAIVISGDVGWRKPSRKIFEIALDALGVASSEAVFVGDAPYHDIEGAKKMGMKTIMVKKESVEEGVNKENPDKIIRRIKELPEVLLEL